jgi:ubiquinone/menaquinone biosynthesis C-methylase UbiE
VPTMRWPPPPPGRVRWAWLLGLGWRRRRVRRLLAGLGSVWPQAGTLVDVGAGTGVAAEEAVRLAPPGAFSRILLLDPQVGMLQRARSQVPGGDRVRADACRLPLPDATADLLLSFGVLCCMTEAAVPDAVRESFRVVRPGGRLVFAVPRIRGAVDEPRFLAVGFRRIASPRVGWAIYQRPVEDGVAPSPRA